MSLSIVLYNNKYYLYKIIYYSYSSAIYIGQGLSSGLNSLGRNIYYFIYDEDEESLNNIDPLLDKSKLLMDSSHYINPLPSAPPMDLLSNNIIEYVMVEKNDLRILINSCSNIEIYNKYKDLLYN